MSKLHKLGKSKVSDFDNKINALLQQLQGAVNESNRLREFQIRIELLKDQETYWFQRSRTQWIVKGRGQEYKILSQSGFCPEN